MSREIRQFMYRFYQGNDEYELAQDFLTAFRQNDKMLFEKCTVSSSIKYLELGEVRSKAGL